MSVAESVTLRTILEECRDGTDGAAFNEVVVMLESTAASAEVWMDFDDLRFTPDGRVVTLTVPSGTQMHLDHVRDTGGGVRTNHQRPGPALVPAMAAGRRRQPGYAHLPAQVGRGGNQSSATPVFPVSAGEVSRADLAACRPLRPGRRTPLTRQRRA